MVQEMVQPRDFHQILSSLSTSSIHFSTRLKIFFTHRVKIVLIVDDARNKEKNHFSRYSSRSFVRETRRKEFLSWDNNISRKSTNKINRNIYPIWIKERNIFLTQKNFAFDTFTSEAIILFCPTTNWNNDSRLILK